MGFVKRKQFALGGRSESSPSAGRLRRINTQGFGRVAYDVFPFIRRCFSEMSHTVSQQSVDEDRRNRDALVEAMHRLDLAWMAPQCGRPGPWRQLLSQRLQEVCRLLEEHARQLESPQGLMSQIAQQEPRLLDRIEQLRREHRELVASARELQQLVDKEPAEDPLQLRQQVERFLKALREHNARENDLIYEALETDVGVGD